MWWSGKRKGSALRKQLRDALFADASLEEVASRATSRSDDIWSHFAAARQALRKGDKIGAIQELRRVEEMEGLETRPYLQVWHCLRTLGELPPENIAREVKGVVVEVGLDGGGDLVAGYSDHTARYVNHTGRAGIVWDAPEDTEIASLIDALLQAGEAIIENTGPLDRARLPASPDGMDRINVLTVGGLHFGQGDFAWPAINAALALMTALKAKDEASQEQVPDNLDDNLWLAGSACGFVVALIISASQGWGDVQTDLALVLLAAFLAIWGIVTVVVSSILRYVVYPIWRFLRS